MTNKGTDIILVVYDPCEYKIVQKTLDDKTFKIIFYMSFVLQDQLFFWIFLIEQPLI